MSPEQIFIYVDGSRISLAAFIAMEREIHSIDARGCTALTALDAKSAKTVDASGCTALTALDAKSAKTVYASGCTALTALDAKSAKTVDASGCTALTALDAKSAEYVYASGCTALTALDAPPSAKIEKAGDAFGYFFAGLDSRGYIFEGITIRGQWRVVAGCRNFSIDDALRHWGPGGQSDRKDCMALAEKIAAFAAKSSI